MRFLPLVSPRLGFESIGESPKTEPPEVKKKNPAAVALGRLGGLKGVLPVQRH
jgi:hypothetical protein